MIEIEQQFPFSPDLLPVLQRELSQTSKIELRETYFDTQEFLYLRDDTWIRERNQVIELKYRRPEDRGKQLEMYLELTSEDEIKNFLKVPEDTSLSSWISKYLVPIIKMNTTRYSFRKDPFTIDVDTTDFGYSVCEIEYSANTNAQTAKKEILSFSKQLGLKPIPAQNKAKAYIRLTYPNLVQELSASGILY